MLTFLRDSAGFRRLRTILVCLTALSTSAVVAHAEPIGSDGAPRHASRSASRATLPHVASVLARNAPLHIVAFGSSSTEGIGASSRAASYPSRLEATLQAALPGESVSVINHGIGGDDVDDMIRRLVPDIIDAHPDLVIWQTGTNDPLKHVPLDRFVAETRAGVAAMHRAGIDVVLMGPQYCAMLDGSTDAAAFRQAVRDLGDELHVPVIRRFSLMRRWLATGRLTRAQLLAPDGLHMADGGYAALAKAVAREILAAAGSLTPPRHNTAAYGIVGPHRS
jgi:lysophospholipase L1-like esterase